jgi:hypothetical protein
MTDEKSLVVRQELTPDIWRMITDIAPAMLESRLFGVKSKDAAAAIMLKGYELGLSLTASFEFIHVIQDRPSLSPRGTLALIQQSPNFAGMRIEDVKDEKTGEPVACRVWMRRVNGFEYQAEYTIAEAEQAGLVKADSGWKKYPANMLRWRAVGYCADVVFPDVIGGMKRSDELGADITPEGDVWKSPIVVDAPRPAVSMVKDEPAVLPQKNAVEEIPDYGYTLQKLLETVPDADVLAASNDAVPSPDQVNAVVHKLVLAGKITLEKKDEQPST